MDNLSCCQISVQCTVWLTYQERSLSTWSKSQPRSGVFPLLKISHTVAPKLHLSHSRVRLSGASSTSGATQGILSRITKETHTDMHIHTYMNNAQGLGVPFVFVVKCYFKLTYCMRMWLQETVSNFIYHLWLSIHLFISFQFIRFNSSVTELIYSHSPPFICISPSLSWLFDRAFVLQMDLIVSDMVRGGKPSLIYHPCPAWPHWCPGHSAWWKESCPVTGHLLWPAADFWHKYFHERCSSLPARQSHVHVDSSQCAALVKSEKSSGPNWVCKMSSRTVITDNALHQKFDLTRKFRTDASCLATSSFQLTDTDLPLFK